MVARVGGEGGVVGVRRNGRMWCCGWRGVMDLVLGCKFAFSPTKIVSVLIILAANLKISPSNVKKPSRFRDGFFEF